MKNTLIALAFIPLLFMLPSCKKNKRPKEKEDTEKPAESSGQKSYLPVRFESTSLNISLKYKEDTNLLTEISGSDGNRTSITYTSAQIPLKLESYKNATLLKLIDYFKDGQQRIKQCTLFEYDAINRSYIPLGDIQINYNGKDQISNLKFLNNLNIPTREFTMSYNTAGNLSAAQLTAQSADNNTFNYTYDQQPGIYKHVPYASLFAIELEAYFLNGNHNNVLSYSDQKNTVENSTYTYEYNQEGYPVLMIISKNKTVQRFKISYIEFQSKSIAQQLTRP